jgi:hypothetical protein
MVEGFVIHQLFQHIEKTTQPSEGSREGFCFLPLGITGLEMFPIVCSSDETEVFARFSPAACEKISQMSRRNRSASYLREHEIPSEVFLQDGSAYILRDVADGTVMAVPIDDLSNLCGTFSRREKEGIDLVILTLRQRVLRSQGEIHSTL